MADDHSQRPYRASEPPVRGPAKAPGSDPLAELARLIGQTDPFAEFGRDTARRAPPQQAGDRSDWDTPPAASPYAPQAGADPQSFAPAPRSGANGYYTYTARPTLDEQSAAGVQSYGENYGRQPYGDAALPIGDNLYQAEHEVQEYPTSQAGYQHDAYGHEPAQYAEEEYYDDVPPSRRRLAILTIAGVFALAVIGTAGAYGYRALFGSSGASQPPPVIKADTGPSKIVPATMGKDAQTGKLITDRLNELGQSEKLVSRQEQPIDKPPTVVMSQVAQPSPMGSGIVGSEPKKVRTIAIRPDQSVAADATQQSAAPLAVAAPALAPPPAPAAARAAAPPVAVRAPASRPPPDNTTADAEQDSSPPPVARAVPAVRQVAPAPSNAPLSLNPSARPAPARTASVAPAAQAAQPAPAAAASNASSGGAGSYVQISSQRSEAEAQSAFRGLQAKFPTQLGGRQMQVHKVELGDKGTYYRAMVGPFASANEAAELCTSLKAAGGQCLLQRN
jgi:SPOR domain